MQTVINNNLIYYEKLGNKKNNLVILHGWGRSHHDWINIGQRLSSHFTVYLIDLPGHGNSKLKPGSSLDTYDYANLIYHFLKKIKLSKITLMGQSFGGKISLIIASRHPELINLLLLVDNAGLEKRSITTNFKIILVKILNTLPVPIKIKNNIKYLLSSRDYKKAGKLSNSFKQIISQNLDKEANKIKVETLIIWGDKDQEVPIKWAKKAKTLIKNSTLRIVYGAGHHPHLEKPDQFLEILSEYL